MSEVDHRWPSTGGGSGAPPPASPPTSTLTPAIAVGDLPAVSWRPAAEARRGRGRGRGQGNGSHGERRGKKWRPRPLGGRGEAAAATARPVPGNGNAGTEFAGSLHNAGAETIELLARRHGASLRLEKGVHAGAAVTGVECPPGRPGRADDVHERVRVGAVGAGLVRRFGIAHAAAVVIVHVALDLVPGTVRLKAGGGLAGHNGLRSVQAHLHSTGLPAACASGWASRRARPRARRTCCGGRPRRSASSLAASVQTAADAVERIVADGMDAAMLWCHSLPDA